jgi:DNA helicase-2/ATP-dependent DNA helicase PcrA
MAFKPSSEQQAIFDYALARRSEPGKKALAIQALAGTGKTTTLVELVKLLGSVSGVYVALNRSIVTEVEPKFKGTGIVPKTFHSLGNGALRKAVPGCGNPDGNKYRKLAEAWYASNDALREIVAECVADIEDDDERRKARLELEKATINLMKDTCDWLRLKLVNWQDMEALAHLINYNHLADDVIYDAIVDIVLQDVAQVMTQAETDLKQKGSLDFTDMIYWCVRWKLSLPKHYYILADEVQDMNPMQRAMIQMSLAENSFLIAVGDVFQAIYNFAGADSDSFDLTVKAFNCHVLPLTVTRRCARVITYHAQTLVSNFTAVDTAPRGKIVWLEDKLLNKHAEKGDLIVSRVKAPLVGACLDLLAAGKAATIIGSDIGKSLMKVLDKIQNRKGFTWADFDLHLQAYLAAERAKLLKKHDEAAADAISDQCEALRVVYERTQPANAEILIEEIDNLFKDEAKNTIKLCTAHKSKGLEAERVFLLSPGKFPLAYPTMTDEQRVQEGNLEYVAITRAKHTLVYLVDRDFRKNHAKPSYVQDGTFDDLVWNGETLIREKEVEDDAPVVAVTPKYKVGDKVTASGHRGVYTITEVDATRPPFLYSLEGAEPGVRKIVPLILEDHIEGLATSPSDFSPIGECPADGIGEKVDSDIRILPPKEDVLPPNPFVKEAAPLLLPRPGLLDDMSKNGKLLGTALEDDETHTPDYDVTQEAELTPPAPFKATGNLKKDFAAAKQNAHDRIAIVLGKLTLAQAITLRELLDEVITELEEAS